MTDTNPLADRTAEIRALLADAGELNNADTNNLAFLLERLDAAEARVEELERQLAKALAELEEQRWYGEQLQTSVDSCSGNHLEIEEYPGGGPDEH
jgi:DNA-binding transcriptional MerR regulator